MSSEEYLKQVTIGEVAVHNQQIELLEYDSNWPILYLNEQEQILDALGNKNVEIEHVGSTSVPGLCAKPIIDIVLLVKDSTDESSYVEALEKKGYVLRVREQEWFEHRMFKKVNPSVNLHVFSQECEEAERMLLFRDWLRSHDGDRDLYAETKRKLAKKQWKYIQFYADAKTEVVKEIMSRAKLKK